jgi:hypothetical protein
LVLSIVLVLLSISLLVVTATAEPVNGAGTVYAYSDLYDTPLPTDSNAGGSWMVHNGETIYLQIAGIPETEFGLGEFVEVRIGYTDAGGVKHTQYLGTHLVKILVSGAGEGQPGVGDSFYSISWIVGVFECQVIYVPYCSICNVEYRSVTGDKVYVASGTLAGGQNHLHVVPEFIFGTAGALMSVAAAAGVFALAKRRKLRI